MCDASRPTSESDRARSRAQESGRDTMWYMRLDCAHSVYYYNDCMILCCPMIICSIERMFPGPIPPYVSNCLLTVMLAARPVQEISSSPYRWLCHGNQASSEIFPRFLESNASILDVLDQLPESRVSLTRFNGPWNRSSYLESPFSV